MIFHLTFRRTLLLFLCILVLQSILLCFIFLDLKFENIQALLPPLNNGADSNLHHDHPHHCRIDDPQAISALKRVRSAQCRQRLTDVYCSIKQNLPWPERIQARCQHFDPNIHGKLIHCSGFDPKRLERATKSKTSILSNQTNDRVMDHNNCIEWCLQTDHELALYHRKHCICTDHVDEPPNNGSMADLHYYCDMNCALNPDHCPEHVFTYLTGFKKIPYYLPGLDIINQPDGHQGFVRPKIVFLLLLNGRSVQQVLRLLKNIHLMHHYYYIHVDSNDNYLFQELKYLEDKFSNIKLARKRFNTIWGGSSLLTCILESIKTILHHWSDWDFVLNLSGTDFPIKKIQDLELYLGRNYGKNFIKSHGKSTEDFIRTQALNKLFVQCDRHLWRIGDRKLIKGIVWDGGSDWVILNRNFSTYLVHSKDSLLIGLINYFHYALLPAESFFHIILRNTEFCPTIINNNLHATNWNRKKGCDCQQKHTVVDWCGCSPNVFRMVDLPRLMRTQTRPLFFARKFEPIIDSEVIDFIEMRFLSNNFALDNGVGLYLENIYHHQYDDGDWPVEKFRWNFYRSIIEQSLTSVQNFGCLNHHYRMGGKNIKLLEAYLVFENGNHFKETLLKISISQAIQAELLIRRKVSSHHPTNLLQTNTMISPRLKSLVVCNRFDEKEETFRNFECLLGQNEPIQVVHEWQPFFGVYRIVFLFFDSQNHMVHHESIILNETKIEDQHRLFYRFPAEKSSNKRHGLWRLLVVQQEQNQDDPILLGIHRFMILPDRDGGPPKRQNQDDNYQEADVRYMKLVENDENLFPNENVSIGLFWSIEQYCIKQKNNYDHHNHFNGDNNVTQCDHFLPNENCDQVDWSVEHWKRIIRIL